MIFGEGIIMVRAKVFYGIICCVLWFS